MSSLYDFYIFPVNLPEETLGYFLSIQLGVVEDDQVGKAGYRHQNQNNWFPKR